ncbi:MAG: hypothetical protein ACOYYU_17610 [Chloroflexota bacterium]
MKGKRKGNKIVIATIAVIAVIVVGIGALHLYLYYTDNDLAFYLFGRPVLKLGWANENVFPKDKEGGYDIKKATNTGDNVRFPKWGHEAVFTEEKEGLINVRMVGTGEDNYYLFTEDTGYICADRQTGNVIIEDKELDPREDPEILKDYVFAAYGDGFRGVVGEMGLAMLRSDAALGDPMKVYTEEENSHKALQIVLFTSKGECVGVGKN